MCIPESEDTTFRWTKGQGEFVGTKFDTPKGGVLTVIGVDSGKGKNGKWNNKFILECSICSKDQELWPVGSIKSRKGNLVRAQIPCGCSKITNWSEKQFKIRVGREAERRGYIFHGWYGEYNGNKTFLDLSNTTTGNRWQSTNIGNFFTGYGDPVAGYEKIGKANLVDDSQHIKDFMDTGAFLEGTKFTRSDREDCLGRKTYWTVECPKCSNDEYILNGLCDGVFISGTSHLKKGQNPCRCNTRNYTWTQEQREYQIKKVFNSEGGLFVGWEKGSYKNHKSKFNWLCSEGHACNISVSNFLDNNNRCPSCANYGYDPSKDGRLYLVEWFGFGKTYLKKGITNNETLTRVKQQNSKSKLDYRIIREIHSEDGQLIADFESSLKKRFKGSACPKEWMEDGYTETVENTPENFKYLMEKYDEFEKIVKENQSCSKF